MNLVKSRLLVGSLAALLSLFCAGCGKPTAKETKAAEGETYSDAKPERVGHLHVNQLGGEPTDFLRLRADDPLHWQPWTAKLFEDAGKEQRLVFAVIGSGRFSDSLLLLDRLRRRPALAASINEKYVCSLIDLEVNPELAQQMSILNTEIKRPLQFPAIAWFSPEGNPVAWLPLSSADIENFEEVFGNSEVMVSRIWAESPRYVMLNSARDNRGRVERNKPGVAEQAGPDVLESLLQDSARQIAALYDPASQSIDGGGGLVPGALLHFATVAGASPLEFNDTSPRLRLMAEGATGSLLKAAIHDPLDGGFFAARRARGWELPQLFKTTDTQSEMARALASTSRLLGDDSLMVQARKAMAFAEESLSGGSEAVGTYIIYRDETVNDRAFFWSQEQLRELLPEDEFEVASLAYGITGLGNVPLEADPRRDFFRKNTLGLKTQVPEIATSLGQEPSVTTNLLESARKRLLTQRNEVLERTGAVFSESARITAVNARFARTLAELAKDGKNPEALQRARTILAYLRKHHYSKEGGLLRVAPGEGRRTAAARGDDYSALLSALFAVYRVDLDPAHLAWAMDLAEEAVRVLADEEGLLSELPLQERFSDLPIYSTRMLFGDSTWGTIYGPLERLVQLSGSEVLRKTSEMIPPRILPLVGGSAQVHTDFLTSLMILLTGTVVRLEGTPGEAGFDALHAVLLQTDFDSVTVIHRADGLPEGINGALESASPGPGATVIVRGQVIASTEDPRELDAILRKRGENRE